MTIRLVLFDIDGTLLRTGNRVHGRAITQAATEITGHDIRQHFGTIDAGGRTDRYIVSELLRRCQMDESQIAAAFDRIAARSVDLTREGLVVDDPSWVLEGARTLIDSLEAANTAFGLVTGNLPEVAQIKLSCAQLWAPFERQIPLITGFGDVSENRNDLSAAALTQARAELFHDLQPSEVAIIGDTPRDIECAHAIGAVGVGVLTGHYTGDDLKKAKADVVVGTLQEIRLDAFPFA